MTGKRYASSTIADLQDERGWSPIRKRFGVESFGINAWTVGKADERIIPEHDEVASGHEELYVVVAGRARFTVDGEEVDGPTGTVLYVPDPEARRAAYAREPNTTVLAIGAAPGRSYRSRSWELGIGPLFDSGEHEELKRVLVGALGNYEDNGAVLYNLACAEALLGETDAAIEHLGEALDADPALEGLARDDSDFEALRSDERFAALLA